MRFFLGIMVLAALGCDDGGGGSSGPPIMLGDAAIQDTGAGGGGGGDLYDQYCEGIGTAKCEYVFRCVQGGARGSVFGLAGPDLEDCVAGEATRCLDDVRDRVMRGTIRDLQATEIDTCQSRMSALACPPGSASDWVGDFYRFYGNACTSAGLGNVTEGMGCARRTDCQNRDHLCINNTCRAPQPVDIMEDCTATGNTPFALNADATCAGEVCAQVPSNDDDKAGICTADCTEGFGCPSGSACLQTSGLGGRPSWFCTWPCTSDRDCRNDFECHPINEREPDGDKHCTAGQPPEE